MRPNQLLAIVGLSWLLISGCQGTTIVNPVSDGKTSQIDERLLGTYVGVSEPMPSRKPKELQRVVIQRSKNHPSAHEIMFRELDGNNNAQVYKWLVWTTRLGELQLASVPAPWGSSFTATHYTTDQTGAIVPVDRPGRYWIFAYELRPSGELYIREVNHKHILAAIEKGELKGELTPRLPAHPDIDEKERREAGYGDVRVTASTEELAAFFRKHQFAAFQPESKAQLLYRRIK